MKNIAKIIAAGSVLFAMTACSHVAKYTTYDFVAFAATSYTVNESTTTLVIPVCAYPENGEPNTTVTFDVKDASAVAGTDFTFAPANGVLNFSGEKAQSITVTILGHPGVFTGDLKFTIELKDASNDYEMNSYAKATVTIKDEDHPLLDLFGKYTMGGEILDTSGYVYETWTMNVSAYEGDVTRIWLDVTAPIFSSGYYGSYFKNLPAVYGIVSSDKETITIPCPQETAANPNDLFSGVADDHFYFYEWDDDAGKFITEKGSIVFTKQDDGSYMTEGNFGFASPSETGGLFYYWMNCWGASFKKQ